MYSLSDYGAMIADRVRMDAYEEALREVVTSDSVVLDIGAGVGIMSLIAARMGARRVIAVEPNPLVRIGARLAVENDFSARISVIRGLSQQIELNEKADVVVGDLRGSLPNRLDLVEAFADARRRLMKSGGTIIPLRDTVFAAPVEANEAYSKLVSPWTEDDFGIRMTAASAAALSQGLIPLEKIDRLLGPGRRICSLEYSSVDSPNFDATIELPIETSGRMHGLALWFDTELVPGVGFSTAPDQGKTVYGRVFLPLPESVVTAIGDCARVRIKAVLDGELRAWIWRGRINDSAGQKKVSFSQASTFANPESPDTIEVFHGNCAPDLSREGQIVREILLGIDGRKRVSDLAEEIMADHPARFDYEEDAVNFVRSVAERYCEAALRLED